MLDYITKDISFRKIVLNCGAYAAPNKGTTIYFIMIKVSKDSVESFAKGKNQGLFKAFKCFSSTFQGKFNFQGLFKTVL